MSKLPTTGRANANFKCLPNYYAQLIQCNILKFVTILAASSIFVRMTFLRGE